MFSKRPPQCLHRLVFDSVMISFYKNEALVGEVDFTEPMLNLLAHAQAIELDIGSRCGGHGICGGDRVQIFAQDFLQLSPITEVEKEHLTTSELEAGWRLACQCFPNTERYPLKLRY